MSSPAPSAAPVASPPPAPAAPAAPKPVDPNASLKAIWKPMSPFVFGGVSGMFATCIIQPLDMIKVRLQLSGEGGGARQGFGGVVAGIIKNEGCELE